MFNKNTLILTILIVSFFIGGVLLNGTANAAQNPRVKIETSMGVIVVELNQEKAPITVANFTKHVNGGFYDGSIFHRVVKGFVVQGGGYNPEGKEKPTQAPIRNESYNGLKNIPGSIAMARSAQPHSAKAQFYFNTGTNQSLDGTSTKFGYAVFGQVVEGMDVVLAIEKVEVSEDLYLGKHRPIDDVIIKKVRLVRKAFKMP